MGKPKVAFYWDASCGGCEEAVVDLAEKILDVVAAVDIVFWPVAMDFKKEDVEAMEDGSIAACFINGAVRTDEQVEMSELLRRKSQLVVAFGSCSHMGGIPGLANLSSRAEIMDLVYHNSPGLVNPEGTEPQVVSKVPEGELTLPAFHESVKALDQVIDVDYYLPGCAPPPDMIMGAVLAILEGKLPPKGEVLAPNKTLCESCKRADTKPEKIKIKEIKRPALHELPEDKCLLAEGFICMGPATRDGCGVRCLEVNMPCRGCFGPPKGVEDQGAKFLSALCSIVDSEDPEEIEKLMETVIDPAGLFYMFSLPTSMRNKFYDKIER